jgi:hypothetical protein
MSMPTWINLSRAVRREMEATIKRGPTPFEVAMLKIASRAKWESTKRPEIEEQYSIEQTTAA